MKYFTGWSWICSALSYPLKLFNSRLVIKAHILLEGIRLTFLYTHLPCNKIIICKIFSYHAGVSGLASGVGSLDRINTGLITDTEKAPHIYRHAMHWFSDAGSVVPWGAGPGV